MGPFLQQSLKFFNGLLIRLGQRSDFSQLLHVFFDLNVYFLLFIFRTLDSHHNRVSLDLVLLRLQFLPMMLYLFLNHFQVMSQRYNVFIVREHAFLQFFLSLLFFFQICQKISNVWNKSSCHLHHLLKVVVIRTFNSQIYADCCKNYALYSFLWQYHLLSYLFVNFVLTFVKFKFIFCKNR